VNRALDAWDVGAGASVGLEASMGVLAHCTSSPSSPTLVALLFIYLHHSGPRGMIELTISNPPNPILPPPIPNLILRPPHDPHHHLSTNRIRRRSPR
jgi:hypothetical protein